MNGEVFLQGKRYLSSRLASEIFGYTNDYIGQLIRGGKLEGQKMGRTWFVSEDSLNRHKVSVSMFSAKSETPATPSPVEPEEGETEVETEAEAELSQSKLSSAKYAVTIGVVLFFSASFWSCRCRLRDVAKVGGEVVISGYSNTRSSRPAFSSVSGEVGKFEQKFISNYTSQSISALSKFVFSPWTGDRKILLLKRVHGARGFFFRCGARCSSCGDRKTSRLWNCRNKFKGRAIRYRKNYSVEHNRLCKVGVGSKSSWRCF